MRSASLLLALLLAGCATARPAPVRSAKVYRFQQPVADLKGRPLPIKPEDWAACDREADQAGTAPYSETTLTAQHALLIPLLAFGAVGGAVAGAAAGSMGGGPHPLTGDALAARQEVEYEKAMRDCLRARWYYL